MVSLHTDERIKFDSEALQDEFLLTFQQEKRLNKKEFAEFLGVTCSTLCGWMNEAKTLPKSIFDKICEHCPRLKILYGSKTRILPSNWAQIEGGRARITKERNVHEFMSVVREGKNKIRSRMKVGTEIKNALVEELIHKNVNLRCILATCLLTDGSFYKIGNSHQITYITKDDVLREILAAILFKLSKYLPRISTDKHGIYYIRVCDFDLGRKLLKLSPTYKKSPNRHQSISDYLKEAQPTIKFLKNCDNETRKWCIRFAFSADGSISLDKRGTAELTLRCSHPKLCFEWQAMLREFGLVGKICKDKFSWSGVGGIRFYDKSSLRNFLNMGGFIPGVKITKKSKFYVGMEKNNLLRMCLRGP